ncbi:PC-esterase domain-containing protein 1A-like [Agrilus planipennis]|uniref:PC-esterase domain-containing protein 1A-like n=1 Tax=Agrilus planipennis TaxID=224129 RepID=A0A1W4WSR1_AGRPL|nr:PC-esterase domain-containing protein 1A-like [Agrilus planipennis]XP_018323533.1 PC-esterase domain-containing protein 1A-like [Agrilus planipennis]XP_018323534.1 PC-esterase domain-containing protein 1A-like [Agrilus planipennis]XP_018323535.1 PC-esterase domain-containing protein 1A-like [Agrilus planipennis]
MSAWTFKGDEAYDLLRNKRILFFGDSNMRALYKDLLWLMYDGTLIPDGKLKDKNEPTFAGDVRLSNGKVHPGTNYVEVREYNLNPYIKFQFITRLFLDGFRLEIENWKQPPDVIVLGSCMWDLSRWGPSGVDDYKDNVVKTFYFLKGQFPRHTQIIWTTSFPPTSKCQGGFLNKNIEFLREALPFQVFEGNVYSSLIAKEYKIEVVDFHYIFKYMLEGHTPDGIHWKPAYVRYATNLLLTHLAISWNSNIIYRFNQKYHQKRSKPYRNNDNFLRF